MTKRDFELIARALCAAPLVRPHDMTDAEARGYAVGVAACAKVLAAHLDKANPRFDKARFLKACGV